MHHCKLIPIQGVRDFDYPVEHKGQEVTLWQILSTIRSKTDPLYREPLFSQSNTTWKGNTVGIVHKNEEEEAKQLINNLCPLMQFFFGPEADDWFDDVTLEVNDSVVYDPESMRVVNKFGRVDADDNDECILKDMHYKLAGMSTPIIRKLQNEGKSLEENIADNQDNSTIDSDRSLDSLEQKEKLDESDEEMNEQEYTFDLSKMINFEPPLGVGPHKDKYEIRSQKTNASGFTTASKYVADLTGEEEPSEQKTGVNKENE